MNKPLSPQQALGILYEATAAVQGNRDQHALIAQALSTLKTAITPQPDTNVKEEKKNERKQTKRSDEKQ